MEVPIGEKDEVYKCRHSSQRYRSVCTEQTLYEASRGNGARDDQFDRFTQITREGKVHRRVWLSCPHLRDPCTFATNVKITMSSATGSVIP